MVVYEGIILGFSSTAEEMLEGFKEFLLSLGLKASSIPNYTVPLRKLLEVYISDKEDPSIFQKNLFLKSFYSDLLMRWDYYLSKTENIKSYNLKRTIEYFGKYLDLLFVEVNGEVYSIVFQNGDVISVSSCERDPFGWFVYEKNGCVYMLNPMKVQYVVRRANGSGNGK